LLERGMVTVRVIASKGVRLGLGLGWG
jgi:hypothetical protein